MIRMTKLTLALGGLLLFTLGLDCFAQTKSALLLSTASARERRPGNERGASPANSGPSTQASTTEPMPSMPLVVPLFIQDRHFTSTLVMVNGISSSSFVDFVLRDLGGTEIVHKRILFAPHSQQRVEIAALLLAAHSGATAGSITITQDPANESMVLAQLTITYLGSGFPNFLDEEVSMPSAQGSQLLRGVADASNGSPLVSITSLITMSQKVIIDCLGESGKHHSKSVQLIAGETLLTEACTDRTTYGGDLDAAIGGEVNGSEEQQKAVGVQLTSDAMPGSFAAFGLARHENRGDRHQDGDDRYFSTFTLDDPKMRVSATNVFAGVPVDSTSILKEGRYVPHVSVANFSTRTAKVDIKYSEMIGTTPSVRDVAEFSVPAGTTRELGLDILEGNPDLQNSFLVSSDASPGDVSTKLVAASNSRLREVELEAKDAMDPQNGGNHPWSVEGGTDSTLLIFNHSSDSQVFSVAFSAGGITWSKAYTLASMQTEAISIRALIANQVKDDFGVVLPRSATSGEVGWFSNQPGVGKGRLLQSNRDAAMARNFSCGDIYVLCGLTFSPGTSTFAQGSTVDYGTISGKICKTRQTFYCTGSLSQAGVSLTYSWSSADSSIAAISGSNSNKSVALRGAGAGTTQITGTVHQPLRCSFSHTGPATVQPAITGPNTVWYFGGFDPAGSYNTSITLTSSGGSSTTWTVTAGGDKINLSTTSGSQTNVTSTGTAFSSSVGDISIKATTAGADSTPFTLTTRKPYELVPQGVSTTCDPNYHYVSSIFYALEDQLLTIMPYTIGMNENWTTGEIPDYTGENWGQGAALGSYVNPASWADAIGGPQPAIQNPNPVADCRGTTTAVEHWGQTWYVGSPIPGNNGVRVQ